MTIGQLITALSAYPTDATVNVNYLDDDGVPSAPCSDPEISYLDDEKEVEIWYR